MSESDLEAALAFQLKVAHLPAAEREHRFTPLRRFRFDFAWPEYLVAVEVDGATWSAGRHSRGEGIHSDCEKSCEAAVLGWRVLRVDRQMVEDGSALRFIERALLAAADGPGTPAAINPPAGTWWRTRS